jgi:protein ImuB
VRSAPAPSAPAPSATRSGAPAAHCVAPDDPLVVVAPIKSALRLTAMNAAAADLGLKVGMALADARAMHPRLVVADADPSADQHLLAAIADWCDRYTPLVGLHPPDGLILDISGCAHLFGGEAALGRDLVRRLRAHGFAARAAIADTVGCAWAVARFADEAMALPPTSPRLRGEVDLRAERERSDASRVRGPFHEPGLAATPPHPDSCASLRFAGNPTSPRQRGEVEQADSACPDNLFLIPSGEMRAALAPLPVAALRLAPDIVTLLAQVGLKRIADLLDRPRAALAARFGAELIWRLDQALGTDAESITPRQPLPRYVAEQRFADPIGLERDVLGTIQRLGIRLAATLERHGEGARLIEVVLFRVDGKVLRLSAATSRPIRDAALVRRLFAERLAAIGDAHDPGFGFDMIRLSVLVSEPLVPQQTGFDNADHRDDLFQLIDRLGARVGFHCVQRLMPHDTYIPEFAVVAVRADQASSFPSATASEAEAGHLAPLRPLTLFERPEPIEAIAEVPDGPPVRFRWRHVLHEVAVAEGPERLAMEWWRDAAGVVLTRDYFRIESREGARFWLYREGLYARETPQPRWFMHGLFA